METRLSHAEKTLAALTPPRGRGKRQITDEVTLLEAIDKVLKDHRVSGLLSVAWEQQIERKTQYVGWGRGSVRREKWVIENVRYHITRIARQEATIADLTQRSGWKVFVTNASRKRLSLQAAVLCYRNEYRVERIFDRLKSRVHIAPLFVKLNEQIEGLTYILTLGVRVLTVMEFVLRQSLAQDQASLPGLHPENKQKRTDKGSWPLLVRHTGGHGASGCVPSRGPQGPDGGSQRLSSPISPPQSYGWCRRHTRYWCGHHLDAASSMRRWSRSRPARPNIWRVSICNRVRWPSTGP